MKLPCEIIRDLLPLYTDGVCSAASTAEVDAHLNQCPACKAYYEAMTAEEESEEVKENMKFKDGMKKIKYRMNRRAKIAVACTVCIAVLLLCGYELFFNLPVRKIDPKDVQVSAQVYAVDELPQMEVETGDDTSVKISKGEDDYGEIYQIQFPSMPYAEITMTENALDDTEFATVIHWNSQYNLRTINWKTDADDSILYVQDFKTTILNNRADVRHQTVISLEMRRISKIVYLEDDGSETILWEK